MQELVASESPRSKALLEIMPFTVPFSVRAAIFEKRVAARRAIHQPQDQDDAFANSIHVRVRRGYVLESGLEAFNKLRGEQLMKKVRVVYLNAAGAGEAGIDSGGLFKEMWTDLANEIFDPNFGLWALTNDNLMYPNPNSAMVHGRDHLRLFEFVGKVPSTTSQPLCLPPPHPTLHLLQYI